MNFIQTEDVVKQFSGHRALNGVSINVPKGSIFGLLGPNGAGKTTLIRIINRITAPDSGIVRIDGRELQMDDVYRIGYMPEERGLYKKMKVGEQAVYFAQLKGLPYATAKKKLMEWFRKFEIETWWNRKLEELSKGMQQKVQFIITVVHNPDLLIFDEPFSGFDPVNAEMLKKEILELKNSGKTIIFSTHNMASVEEICDEIALINSSEVVLSGSVREIRKRYKSNTFVLQIPRQDSAVAFDAKDFTVLGQQDLPDATELRIKKLSPISNSELIASIAGLFEILSFTEEYPSMNEVFINTVSGIKTENV